jgi:hypothetical protein
MQAQHLAYLDAGTGSMIASAAVAGAAGVAVAAKMGWRRLTGTFRRGTEPGAVEQHGETGQVERSDA